MVRRILMGVIALAVASVLQAQTSLRVISFPGGANLPLWVAEDTGLFAREHLAVTAQVSRARYRQVKGRTRAGRIADVVDEESHLAGKLQRRG